MFFGSSSYCLCKCKHCFVFLALGVNEFVLFIMPLQIYVKDQHTHINNLANVCFQIFIINQLCTPLV